MLALLLSLAPVAFPQTDVSKLHPLLRARVVDPEQRIELEREFRVYAVLSDRILASDLAQEVDGMSRKERCEHVHRRLTRHAEASQQELLDLLDELEEDGEVTRIRPLWITNTVAFQGTLQALERVAELEGVERIGWDPPRPSQTADDDDKRRTNNTLQPVPTIELTQVYYTTGFEGGVLGSEFGTATTNCGDVSVTDQYGPFEGTYHVVLGATSNGCESTAELTLTLDLSSAQAALLRFSFKDLTDEFDPGEDIVEASDDGGQSWTKVLDLDGEFEGIYLTRTNRLDNLGLELVSDFKIRWRWSDGSAPPLDGLAIDSIAVASGFHLTPSPEPEPNLVQLQAPDLWEMGFTGQGVVLLNIDRGVDTGHPDLSGKIFQNPLEVSDGIDNDSNGYIDDIMGWDFVDDDNTPLPTTPFGQHGTNTAGIMVGEGFARTGMAPGAKLAIAKIDGESDQWAAIQWGLSVGVDCMSSSNSFKWDWIPKPDYHMHREVQDIVLTAGIIFANSIGNLGGSAAQPIPFQITAPACVPAPWRHPDQSQGSGGVSAVMACGGIELDDTSFSQTSIGPSAWEDITLYDATYPHAQQIAFWDYAFGGFGGGSQGLIKPDVVAYTNVLTTSDDDEYVIFGGTSASTAHLGGAFALLLSASPGALPAQIAQVLQETAVDMGAPGKDATYGAGRIQVKDAATQLFSLISSSTTGPALGEAYELTVTGFPGDPFAVGLAWTGAAGGLKAHGRWRIGPSIHLLAAGALDASGRARLAPLVIPDDESLVGMQLHHQVVTDNRRGMTGGLLYSPVETITIGARARPRARKRRRVRD